MNTNIDTIIADFIIHSIILDCSLRVLKAMICFCLSDKIITADRTLYKFNTKIMILCCLGLLSHIILHNLLTSVE